MRPAREYENASVQPCRCASATWWSLPDVVRRRAVESQDFDPLCGRTPVSSPQSAVRPPGFASIALWPLSIRVCLFACSSIRIFDL